MALCALTVIVTLQVAFASLVKWVPDNSFNLAINFDTGKLPCGLETVVFPDSLSSAVRLEPGVVAAGFVLPLEGELALPADGDLPLGGDGGSGGSDDPSCRARDTIFSDPAGAAWDRPDVWSSDQYNEATPDADRMPCFDDVVEFPPDARFSIALPDRTQYVREIRVDGRALDADELRERASDDEDRRQRFVLNRYLEVGVDTTEETCTARAGCPCQRAPLEPDCSARTCVTPACVGAVRPAGACCAVCGGVVRLPAAEVDRAELRYLVERTLEERSGGGGGGAVRYHVGRPRDGVVQLVVVEVGQYTGESAAVAEAVARATGAEAHVLASGSPARGAWGGAGAAAVALLAVTGALAAVAAVYYPPRCLPLPLSRLRPRPRPHRSDSEVTLTRRDSGAPPPALSTAFRNPLYDSRRGRVTVTATEEHDDS